MPDDHETTWDSAVERAIDLLQAITPQTMDERGAHKELFDWLQSLRPGMWYSWKTGEAEGGFLAAKGALSHQDPSPD